MVKKKSSKTRAQKNLPHVAQSARSPREQVRGLAILEEIELANFKPFATKQTIPLAPITVIYGPNSGGKSSIIQSLLLQKQTVEGHGTRSSGLIVRGEYTDLGSYRSLIHKHEINRELHLSLSYNPLRIGRPRRFTGSHPVWRTELTFVASKSPGSRKKDSSKLERVAYEEIEGATSIRLLAAPASKSPRRVRPYSQEPGRLRMFTWADEASIRSFAEAMSQEDKRRFRRRAELGKRLSKEPPAEYEGLPVDKLVSLLKQSQVEASNLLPDTLIRQSSPDPEEFSWFRHRGVLEPRAWSYYELLNSISYLGPLRSYPERHYLITGGARETVGSRGEFTPQIIYRRHKELEGQLDAWFARFELPYRLRITTSSDEVTGDIVSMHLLDERSQVKVAASDVGFGIGQLLPIIVEGLVATNGILCVEQPEIHLHPRLQAHVADLLIETAGLGPSKGKRSHEGGNQWLVETHSEALMLRLQRRIREGSIRASDVSVLYVEPGGEAGSTVRRLHLDERGEFIDEWPGGFFEEGYREVFGAVEE